MECEVSGLHDGEYEDNKPSGILHLHRPDDGGSTPLKRWSTSMTLHDAIPQKAVIFKCKLFRHGL
jgi:hypothetical protein